MAVRAANKLNDDWLNRLKAQDQQVFAEFVEKYKGDVFMCCRTLGLSGDQADDVAGETFLAAYQALPRYKAKAKLGTWLWAIAYRQAVSFLRKNIKYRRLKARLKGEFEDSSEFSPTAAIEQKEEHEKIWLAVRKLPGLWALSVILYYRQGKKISEIAEIMRINENTVKTYLLRARKKLKRTLGPIAGEVKDER